MNRHIYRRGAAGFSFVELLVTIVIAGIVFAAMVPVFVLATKKTGGDNMRNISTQLARDKIEKIRQLDYDEIIVDATHLGSTSFADGQFAPTWSAQTGTTPKLLNVAYTVTPYYPPDVVDPEPGLESYKKVDVVVTWDAPPTPNPPAVLSTIVYKQYAGPAITTFELDPAALEEDPLAPDTYVITGIPVTVDVQIAVEDIASMNAKLRPINDTNKLKMGYVRFTVSSANGAGDIASVNVYEEYNNENGHYQFVWDNSAALDGIYTIAATAYSSSQQEGTSASKSFRMAVTNPPPPANLAGSIGDTKVSLTWANSGIGDFSHYELWRSTPDQAHWVLHVDNITASPSLTDSAVTNGVSYYYKVRVVDNQLPTGNASLFSNIVGPMVPAVVADVTPPTTPGSFTATAVSGQAAITVTWLVSTDPGSPATGVKGYTLERKQGVGAWAQVQSADTFNQLVYTDTGLTWGQIYTYRVQAVDNANLSSAWATGSPVTVGSQPSWTLTVTNADTSSDINVWVQSATTNRWWVYVKNGAEYSQVSKPAATAINKSKSFDYEALPQDTYNITTQGGGTQSLTLDRAGLSVSFSL